MEWRRDTEKAERTGRDFEEEERPKEQAISEFPFASVLKRV